MGVYHIPKVGLRETVLVPNFAHLPVAHIPVDFISEFLDKSKMPENLGSFVWKRGDSLLTQMS